MGPITELNGEIAGGEIENPTWAEVEGVIAQLDGVDCTEVGLVIVLGGRFMVIGGGEDDEYICNIVNRGISLWAASRATPEGVGSVLVSGVELNPPLRNIVGLDDVMIAAREFYTTGEPSSELEWDTDVAV